MALLLLTISNGSVLDNIQENKILTGHMCIQICSHIGAIQHVHFTYCTGGKKPNPQPEAHADMRRIQTSVERILAAPAGN